MGGREKKSKAKKQHYHVYLIIDGDIIHYRAHNKFRCLKLPCKIFINNRNKISINIQNNQRMQL